MKSALLRYFFTHVARLQFFRTISSSYVYPCTYFTWSQDRNCWISSEFWYEFMLFQGRSHLSRCYRWNCCHISFFPFTSKSQKAVLKTFFTNNWLGAILNHFMPPILFYSPLKLLKSSAYFVFSRDAKRHK